MTSSYRLARSNHIDVDALSAYMDRQLSAAEQSRVDDHLHTCEACRLELDTMQQTLLLLHALPRVPVPRAFTLSEVQVGIRSKGQSRWIGNVLRGFGALTAVVAVAFVAVTLLRQPGATAPAAIARVTASLPTASIAAQPAAEQPEVRAATGNAAATVAQPETTAPAVAAKEAAPAAPQAAPPQDAAAPAPAAKAVEATPAPETAPAEGVFEPELARSATAPQGAEDTALALGLGAGVGAGGGGGGGAGGPGFGGFGGAGAAGIEMPSAPISTPEPAPAFALPADVLPQGVGFVYADWRAVWTIDRTAGVREALQADGVNWPQVSSDRSLIAYRVLSQDRIALWVARWDGSGARKLLDEAALTKEGLSEGYTERRIHDTRWVPGRNLLSVITVALPAPSEGAPLPLFELWQVDAGSGALRHLADMGRSSQVYYAPGGAHVALLQYGKDAAPEGSLTLLNTETGEAREALRFPAGPAKPSFDSQLHWLPDGSGLWLAILESPTTGAQPLNGATLYRATVAGQAQKAGRVAAFQTYWSPDGQRLAYTTLAGADSTDGALYLAAPDGSNPVEYAGITGGSFISWSPDGAHFLYSSAGQVWAGAPGSDPQLIGSIASVFDPRWITNNTILALQDTGAEWLLVSRSLNGNVAGLQSIPREASYDIARP